MIIEACALSEEDSFDTFTTPSRHWNGRQVTHLEDQDPLFTKLYKPMGTSTGASVEAKKSREGNASVVGEAHVTAKDDRGSRVSVTAEGSVQKDHRGDVKTEGTVKISVEREF